jgi:hypothetical protein
LSLINDYECITLTCSFAKKAGVVAALEHWLRLPKTARWEYSEREPNPKSIYFPKPPPGSGHPYHFMVWEPIASAGAMFMIDLADGWHGAAAAISKSTHQPSLIVTLSKSSISFPIWSLYWYEEGETRRVVHLLLDNDGWTFFQKGEPLPFEDVRNYEAQRITDRLTTDILLQYLKMLGWDLLDDSIWKSVIPATHGQLLRWK